MTNFYKSFLPRQLTSRAFSFVALIIVILSTSTDATTNTTTNTTTSTMNTTGTTMTRITTSTTRITSKRIFFHIYKAHDNGGGGARHHGLPFLQAVIWTTDLREVCNIELWNQSKIPADSYHWGCNKEKSVHICIWLPPKQRVWPIYKLLWEKWALSKYKK